MDRIGGLCRFFFLPFGAQNEVRPSVNGSTDTDGLKKTRRSASSTFFFFLGPKRARRRKKKSYDLGMSVGVLFVCLSLCRLSVCVYVSSQYSTL